MKTKILKHRVPQRILIGMLLVLFCFTSKAQYISMSFPPITCQIAFWFRTTA